MDLTTTVVAADGTLTREEFKANREGADRLLLRLSDRVDRPGGNSDMTSRRRSEVSCARSWRGSVAVPGLRAAVPAGHADGLRAAATPELRSPPDRALGYNDVLDAWNYYLQHDNNGRGVVLIGHSQGSGVLTQLIRSEIDGKPVQARLISALLLGTNLAVPKGKDDGGAFKHIPLCHSASRPAA